MSVRRTPAPQSPSPETVSDIAGRSAAGPSHSASTLAPILERILAGKQRQVESARKATPETVLRRRAESREPRAFAAALRRDLAGVPAVIAELKHASPSRGVLRNDFDVPAIARAYTQAGAAALSVLTEEDHFLGRLEYLERAARATRLPVLRKDFIFCDYQVWEAAAAGADALLLIVAMLQPSDLEHLLDVATRARLAVLAEVHSAEELRAAVDAGASIIGVNNRDLRDFSVDPELATQLAGRIPAGILRVAESGLRSPSDLRRAAAAGFDAVLIGEAFMTAAEPGAALADLLRAARAQSTSV